jgi:hypothetical protein
MTKDTPIMADDFLAPAHAALDRLKRAHDRGTGCHLTAEMIRGLGLTSIATTWTDQDKNSEFVEPHHG